MYCLCFTGHYSGISWLFCVFIGKILESIFLNSTSKKNYIWVNSSNHRRASESLFVNRFDEQIFRKHLLGVCNYTALNSNMDFVVCFLVEQFWSHDHTLLKSKLVKWVKITQLYPTCCDPMDYTFHSLGPNTGVGSLSLLQWIFPTQGSNQGLLQCRQILYQLWGK